MPRGQFELLANREVSAAPFVAIHSGVLIHFTRTGARLSNATVKVKEQEVQMSADTEVFAGEPFLLTSYKEGIP